MGRHLQIAIDCHVPDRLAAFWAEALEYVLRDPPQGYASWSDYSATQAVDDGEGWAMLVDPDGTGPSILFHRVPETKVAKNRVHLDIVLRPGASADEARDAVDSEVERLVGLGAEHLRTDDDGHDYYAVMQDPEGNEFCVG